MLLLATPQVRLLACRDQGRNPCPILD